jgi:hypothetical protein
MLILSSVLVSASSAEFTPDLVPMLSMTKLADASTAVSLSTLSTVFVSVAGGVNLEGGAEGGGGICFADVLVPREVRSFYCSANFLGSFLGREWR